MKNLSKLIFILFLCTNTVALAQTSWTPSSDNTKMFIYPLSTNVGIGTDNPSEHLQINGGNILLVPDLNSTNGESRIAIGNNVHNGNRVSINYSEVYQQAMIDFERHLLIRASNTSANTMTNSMVLTQDGRVGIGDWPSHDQYKLNVKGSTYFEVPTSSSSINAMNIDVASFETPANAANSSFLKLTDVAQNKTAFVVKGNGNVGIGTENPSSKLNIIANQVTNEMALSIKHSAESNPAFSVNAHGSVRARDYAFNTVTGSSFSFSPVVTSPNAQIRYNGGDLKFHNGTKVTASFNSDGSFRFDNTIYAKEIIVQANVWADDVFSKDYKLRSINEVEEFIKTNNHLPDVPSENSVKGNGINVSEMNAIMLRKIEETMLYVIELKKENEALRQQIESLMK